MGSKGVSALREFTGLDSGSKVVLAAVMLPQTTSVIVAFRSCASSNC